MFTHWHPFPMVRLVLPFSAGLLLADQSDWSCPLPLLLASLLLLTALSVLDLAPLMRQIYGICWFLWVILAGTSWLALHHPAGDRDHWQHQVRDQTARWTGSIREVRHNERWQRLVLEVQGAQTAQTRHQDLSGRLLVYVPVELSGERKPGEVVAFTGRPEPVPPTSDPYGFDWKRYLFLRGVEYQVFLRDSLEVVDTGSTWLARFSAFRAHLEAKLTELIPDDQARQLLQAILLGARDDLGDDLNQAYQASGAVHILAVSGLHVGLVAGGCLFLLGWLMPGRRRHWMVALPTVCMVWVYILLTGAADSALRAGVLFTFLILGRALSRYAEAINLLAAAVLLLLLWDPWMIFHVGFQLSVMAVAGILLLQPLIVRSWVPPDRVIRFFWNLTAVTLAAQIATVFLSLYYFHQFPVYFLLAGWFVVPLSGVVLASGWAILLLEHLLPGLAMSLAWIPAGLATVMNALVFAIASLPGALSTDWSPAAWWAILVPVAAGMMIYALVYRKAGVVLMSLATLVLGLGLDVQALMKRQDQVQWGVVRRQGQGLEVVLREQGGTVLLDLSGERQVVEQQSLNGYGPTWLIPAPLDFTFGSFHKSGSVISRGGRQFAWDQPTSADVFLASSRYPGPRECIDEGSLVLLPWQMKPWHRKAWVQAGVDSILDLRQHGYWIEDLTSVPDNEAMPGVPDQSEKFRESLSF